MHIHMDPHFRKHLHQRIDTELLNFPLKKVVQTGLRDSKHFCRLSLTQLRSLYEAFDLEHQSGPDHECVFASKVATFSHESCHPAAAKLPPLSSL